MRLALGLYFLFSACVVLAAQYSIPGTELRSLPRSANGRNYDLYVGLPGSYATSPTKRYPVIYVCDGYWDFPLINAEVGNLSYDNTMPEAIVVGIGYSGTNPDVGSLRQYDLTPWTEATTANSGHAQEFLAVIADQIIPYVEAQFRVDNSFRVLTGSSYGGLFVAYSLFERPGLFQGYVAPSPSLWWYGNNMLSVAKQYASTKKSLPARVYLTWGADESTAIQSSTYQLYMQLKAAAIPDFSVAARPMAGERHSGPKGESFNRGLRYVFALKAPVPTLVDDPGFVMPSSLVNLSTRGQVGAGEKQLIAGLVIQGNEPKRVLLRAVGPTLKNFGISSPLADPKLTVYTESQVKVISNDNWADFSDTSKLITLSAQFGAFPLISGSKDAACLVTLPPGLYTVIVESADGSEGVALVESYEVTP